MAQNPTAVVRRNAYLRNTASANDKSLVLLKPGDELELLDQQPTNDYLHVRTQDGEEGWIKAGNITIREQPERLLTTLAAPSGGVAEEIASDWEKPDPNKMTFHGVEGNCPWNGDDSDPDTFVRKNRSDTAESRHLDYHDVKWEAIAQAPDSFDARFATPPPSRRFRGQEAVATLRGMRVSTRQS
jgi:hypothetical protein